jgi:hypothetical protein
MVAVAVVEFIRQPLTEMVPQHFKAFQQVAEVVQELVVLHQTQQVVQVVAV